MASEKKEIEQFYQYRKGVNYYLIICLGFGLLIITDELLLSGWQEKKILSVWSDEINWNQHTGGESVTKIMIEDHTLTAHYTAFSLLENDGIIEIRQTAILKRVPQARVFVEKYYQIPLEYSITNGQYLFPLLLCIATLYGLFGGKKGLFYGAIVSTPILFMLLYGLVFN